MAAEPASADNACNHTDHWVFVSDHWDYYNYITTLGAFDTVRHHWHHTDITHPGFTQHRGHTHISGHCHTHS